MSKNSDEILISLKSISHTFFPIEGKPVPVLKNLDFSLKKGEKVAILGVSGSGKSTFLHILSGLLLPTEGSVNRAETGNNRPLLALVLQTPIMIPEFSVAENIKLPLLMAKIDADEADHRVEEALHLVQMYHRKNALPATLSGGELQRVALARALVMRPHCLVADEPTGNLDPKTAQNVMECLLKICDAEKMSLVLVTHNHEFKHLVDRVLFLQEGKLVN